MVSELAATNGWEESRCVGRPGLVSLKTPRGGQCEAQPLLPLPPLLQLALQRLFDRRRRVERGHLKQVVEVRERRSRP